jgi:hypothetical protein
MRNKFAARSFDCTFPPQATPEIPASPAKDQAVDAVPGAFAATNGRHLTKEISKNGRT